MATSASASASATSSQNTTIDITIPCPHSDCVWFSVISQFIKIDYMPKIFCDMFYKSHETFSKKKLSQFKQGSFMKEIIHFHQMNKEHAKKTIIKFGDIKKNIITVFRSLYYEKNEETRKNSIEELKKIIEDCKQIGNQLQESSKKENECFMEIIKKIKDDEPIEYKEKGVRVPQRRQREDVSHQTVSWCVDTAPEEKPQKHKYQKKIKSSIQNVTENDVKQFCNHRNCAWTNIWILMQEITGEIFSNVVPRKVCDCFKRKSLEINEMIY